MRSLSLILVLGLVTACAASTGVEPTDLSEIKIGVPRSKVEARLGKPILRAQTDFGLAEAYTYDRGTNSRLPRNYGGCVGGCALAHMLMLTLSPLAHESIVSGQRGRITIVFNPDGRAQKLFYGKASELKFLKPGSSRQTVDIIFGPSLAERTVQSEKVVTYRYEGNANTFGRLHVTFAQDDSVKSIRIEVPLSDADRKIVRKALEKAQTGNAQDQYFYATLNDDPVAKVKWFCLSGVNGNPVAYYELAILYSQKLPPRKRNPFKALQFYLLWDKKILEADRGSVSGLETVMDQLNQEQIEMAIEAAQNWQSSPESCPN